MNYDPYQYPPNIQLAALHSKCSEPGEFNSYGDICPCCNQMQKNPIKSWIFRDPQEDFKIKGSAVSTYFALLRYYAFTMFLIIAIYSWYQIMCIQNICRDTKSPLCIPLLKIYDVNGIYVIGTRQLDILLQQKNGDKIPILQTMRVMVYFILLFMNTLSLVLTGSQVRRIKRNRIQIQDFSLIIKDIPLHWKEKELSEYLKKINSEIQIEQIFFLKRTDRYQKWYDIKMEHYFKLKGLKKQKEIKYSEKMLLKSVEKLSKHSKDLVDCTGRAIVTFNFLKHKIEIQEALAPDNKRRFFIFLNFNKQQKIYADQLPNPQQIYWNNVGREQFQKTRYKILTFLIVVGLLAISFLLLIYFLELINKDETPYNKTTFQKAIAAIFPIVLVFLGIQFRKFMEKVAQLRKPNTKTNLSLFVLLTSIVFHLLYYVLIPYMFYITSVERSKKLYAISYGALNFLVIQFIFATVDIVYCFWERKKVKILNNQINIYCQKQVHKLLNFPRFPMEFRLIIMFKAWSFVLFYAFEMPILLILIFIIFVFLLLKDKMNTYLHYRIEKIDSNLQYKFLKVYGIFFTVYIYFIFYTTQEPSRQVSIAIGILTLISLVYQARYDIKQETISLNDLSLKNIKLDEKQNQIKLITYKAIYDKYLAELENPIIDAQINDFARKLKDGASLYTQNQQKYGNPPKIEQQNNNEDKSMKQKLLKS